MHPPGSCRSSGGLSIHPTQVFMAPGRTSIHPIGSCRSSGGLSIHPTQVFMAPGRTSVHGTGSPVAHGRSSPATHTPPNRSQLHYCTSIPRTIPFHPHQVTTSLWDQNISRVAYHHVTTGCAHCRSPRTPFPVCSGQLSPPLPTPLGKQFMLRWRKVSPLFLGSTLQFEPQ